MSSGARIIAVAGVGGSALTWPIENGAVVGMLALIAGSGLLHLWAGRPTWRDPIDDFVDAGGFLGWLIGAPIAAAFGSIGGAIVLEPLTMMKMLIYALAAATIGGLDSPLGAVVGGFIVGLAQALAPGYLGIPTELTLLPPLGAMVLALVLRPHGLFGTVPVNRV